MNVLYTEAVSKMLFNQRGDGCAVGELMKLSSEIWNFKSYSEKIFAPHY